MEVITDQQETTTISVPGATMRRWTEQWKDDKKGLRCMRDNKTHTSYIEHTGQAGGDYCTRDTPEGERVDKPMYDESDTPKTISYTVVEVIPHFAS